MKRFACCTVCAQMISRHKIHVDPNDKDTLEI